MACYLAILLLQPQEKPAPFSKRAIDFVSVTSGSPLLGVVLQPGNRTRPTIVAVQREWLKQERPEQYTVFRKQEIKQTQVTRKVVLERLAKWIQQRPDEKDLLEYLKEQQASLIAERVPAEPQSQFMLIELKPKEVRSIKKPSRKLRAPLWVALREKLKDVETRSSESLQKELKEKGIAIPRQPVDLSSRVPSRGDDKVQWAARQAIVEQLYRANPVKMSGTPDMVVRETTDGKPADVNMLIGKMMSGRIASLIKELTEPATAQGYAKTKTPAWFKQTRVVAKEANARAAFVKLVIPDTEMREAVVEAYLIGQMPDGSWRVVWKTRRSVRPGDDEELVDQIREDPQIKQALGALGKAVQGDMLDRALGFGAATMKAQQAVMEDYVKWRDPFFDSLEGPMLVLPKR